MPNQEETKELIKEIRLLRKEIEKSTLIKMYLQVGAPNNIKGFEEELKQGMKLWKKFLKK